jgi:hypothetical protein
VLNHEAELPLNGEANRRTGESERRDIATLRRWVQHTVTTPNAEKHSTQRASSAARTLQSGFNFHATGSTGSNEMADMACSSQ